MITTCWRVRVRVIAEIGKYFEGREGIGRDGEREGEGEGKGKC